MSSEPNRLTVTITGMAYGGRGIGRVDGKVVFVPETRPGDEAEVTVVTDSGKYIDAKLESLKRPADARVKPLCQYFDRCGGCQWQHSVYDEQLAWKKDSIASSLKRIGKIGADFPISMVPSAPFNYRTRATFRVRVEPAKQSLIGYFAAASHEFVAIDECAIVNDSLNTFIQNFAKTSFGNLTLKARLEVLSTVEGLLIFVHTDETWTKNDISEFGAILAAVTGVKAVEIHRGSGGDIAFATWDRQFGLEFLSAPGQFQQANTALNQALRAYVRSVVERVKPMRVLDLFCGNGNLSLGLPVRSVRGIEYNSRAIEAANRSVGLNNLNGSTYEYYATDAEKHLWRVAKLGERFDFVIADPPREGMYKCVPPLLKLAPEWLLYVSCNPTTLARDLGGICRVYTIQEVHAYDFFPQTYHVESVVLLKRNSR
jgi:23S rRNA (uracil1939-C5)-methyltransferase